MPCHAAMIKKLITASADEEVGKVLKRMEKDKIDSVAVVDENNVLQGLFSIQILLKNLLPVSVVMSDGLQLDVTVRAAPGIAKRLKNVLPLPVSELMERKVNVVNPETPTWEGVNFLITHGEPLLVVESDTGKLTGMITMHSALEELERLKDSES